MNTELNHLAQNSPFGRWCCDLISRTEDLDLMINYVFLNTTFCTLYRVMAKTFGILFLRHCNE